MIFNNIDIAKQFRCKVLSKGNTFFTTDKINTVEQMGMVLAMSTSPQVRVITCEILVKAGNRMKLYAKLSELAKFLQNAPVARLIDKEQAHLFYYAKCTSISNPVLKGSTARFSLEFTCTDYRPHYVSSGKALYGSEKPVFNFRFAEKHCFDDFGMVFVLDEVPLLPKQEIYTYDIGGRDGTIRSKGVKLGEMELKGTFYMTKEELPNLLSEKMYAIKKWLLQEDREELAFDCMPDVFFLADVVNSLSLDMKKWENGAIQISFTLQPYAWNKELTEKALALQDETGSISLSNELNSHFACELICTVENLGSAPITKIEIADSKGHKALIELADRPLVSGELLSYNGQYATARIGNEKLTKYVSLQGDLPMIQEDKTLQFRLVGNENAKIAIKTRGKH